MISIDIVQSGIILLHAYPLLEWFLYTNLLQCAKWNDTFKYFVGVMFVVVDSLIILQCAVVVRHTILSDVDWNFSIILFDEVKQPADTKGNHI